MFFISSSAFSKITFKGYCYLYKYSKQTLDPEVGHTVAVLYKLSGKDSCDEAFEYLNSLSSLDLSGKDLRSLKPLSGLENLKVLNVSQNDLLDLWGLELVPELMVVLAHHNRIRNISSLSLLDNLFKVDLSFNRLEFASPLKEIVGIKFDVS